MCKIEECLISSFNNNVSVITQLKFGNQHLEYVGLKHNIC